MMRTGSGREGAGAAVRNRFGHDIDTIFQQTDLPTDGLGREMQALAGTRNTVLPGHDPEIVQMHVVDHGNRTFRLIRTIS
jgi:hypothetical protein